MNNVINDYKLPEAPIIATNCPGRIVPDTPSMIVFSITHLLGIVLMTTFSNVSYIFFLLDLGGAICLMTWWSPEGP
jgi:hypothetical protein